MSGGKDFSGSPSPSKTYELPKPLLVYWWNGGGAVHKRPSVNPGIKVLMKSKPDIFVYGEAV